MLRANWTQTLQKVRRAADVSPLIRGLIHTSRTHEDLTVGEILQIATVDVRTRAIRRRELADAARSPFVMRKGFMIDSHLPANGLLSVLVCVGCTGLAAVGEAAAGTNLIADADMEQRGTAAWPTAGTLARIEKSTRFAHSGRQCLRVVGDDSRWGAVRKEITGLRPGTTYRLSYWVRRVRGDARLDVSVGDGTRWATVFGGYTLGGRLIWWPGSAYITLRDPSETVANPEGELGTVTQIRTQFRPGSAAEFYLDDVELTCLADPLAENLIDNSSFEQDQRQPEHWQINGAVARDQSFAADGSACVRLGPKTQVQQPVHLSAGTWYTLRYEWTTPGRGRVRVGLSFDTPQGRRYVDMATGTAKDTPRFVSPYRQGGFANQFARTGVTFYTADHTGAYRVTFDNAGAQDAWLDAVVLTPGEPASAQWPSFEIPYDGDGSLTGKPLRNMAGFFAGEPCTLDDVRNQRTPIDRDGFIRIAPDGHFVNGRGQRVRFYAVNMGGLFAMPATMGDARRIANRLVKLGVNLVRIHGADYKVKPWAPDRPGLFGPPSWKPGTTELYPESLRRLDALLAQCKAHGIYVQLDLMTSRTFTAADGVAELDALRRVTPWHTTRLFVTSYDRRMIELQKRFQTQLLLHVNQYTGLRYADDPVIASVELKNEEGLLYVGFDRTMYADYPPHYQQQLADRWNEWLRERYPSTAALRAAWVETGRTGLADGERLDAVAFAPELRHLQDYSKARYGDMVRFMSGLVTAYQDEMVEHLRNLGVKCPIRDTQIRSRPCQMRAQARMDYADAHSYWNAPFDRAMVHTAGGNLITPAFLALVDKPMSVSEYNAFSAHQYRAEMPLLFAAYAAFQDWDCIVMHSYGGGGGRIDARSLAFHYIGTYADSPLLAQFPTAAKVFRNGLVRPGRKTVEVRYSTNQCDSGQPVSPSFPPETALVHTVRTVDLASLRPMPLQAPFTFQSPYISDTGELRWDNKTGIVTIQAPQIEAAIGFVGGKSIRLKHLVLKAQTPFAAVSLVALDDRPLSDSARMLLTAAAQAENTAMTWGHDRTEVLNYGYAPVVCEPVEAEVELGGTKSVQVYALGPDAGRRASLNVSRQGNTSRFRLEPKAATLWYEVTADEPNQ